MKNLKCIKIQSEKTLFWRYQTDLPDESLATVEALYFFFRDYETTLNHGGDYEEYIKAGGKWDNLLYYFVFNYQLVQSTYKTGDKKDKDFWRNPGYIKYDETKK